ncbi:MAG TPA: VOC family protein [Bryobacteraceae bacterium]|nr:VOC family protein [Bryobacteraceae bacterium]
MQKITPFLWFDHQAEEAMNFYVSVFKNSKVVSVTRNGDSGPGPKGTLFVGAFEIEGQEFQVLNGGPLFQFTEAISFFVKCESQEEIDDLWQKFTDGGGKPDRCGWLKDKYGVSWQIIPTVLGKLLHGPDAEGSKRALAAMMQMIKLDIAALQKAYDGAS